MIIIVRLVLLFSCFEYSNLENWKRDLIVFSQMLIVETIIL